MRHRVLLFGLAALLFVSPAKSLAAPKFEVSGWMPYWRAATSTADVLPHLSSFTALMPFGYTVGNDGSLHDAFGIEPGTSTTTDAFVAAAHAKKVRIIPTVMWSNGSAIESILSSAADRRALEDDIANLVTANKFDGIDIDFEGKTAETKAYFSLFLKGLSERLGNKFLYCSIEPRTPPSSAFDIIPTNLEYANDFTAIGRYCDRVEIMAYDQGTIDLRLNSAANQAPYIPIADPVWVKKVVQLAAKSIPKSKIVLGVPTYGYEYDLVPITQGYRYNIEWAFNPRYATDLAASLGLAIQRNSAGELSFVYQPTSTPPTTTTTTTTPSTATSTPLRIVWWSDARAIADKLKLAKSLGLRGVAIFKLDGGEDQGLWDVLPKKR